MIGIGWSNLIQAVWELGIGIAPANPIKYQYCI
jgi:hypothetical protein